VIRQTSLVLLWCCSAAVASAQDTRHVTEPVIPPVCAVLRAQLHAEKNLLCEEDEQKLDTERIQRAMDTCASGKAVALRADGDRNAFLSGPLELRSGVTLLVDKGATLYGSRDPKLYDTEPGRCGTSGPESRPCKPLISAKNVKEATIMGDGTIDGRGGSTLIGKSYSWWQQSRAAEPTNARYSAPRLLVANQADGLVLYRIRLYNSPQFHVSVNRNERFYCLGGASADSNGAGDGCAQYGWDRSGQLAERHHNEELD
jgi:polygalacturonase